MLDRRSFEAIDPRIMICDHDLMSEHAFDILGVGDREDCYTNLLAYAFDVNVGFREAFLQLMVGAPTNPDGWRCRARRPFHVREQKTVPDLVVWNATTRHVAVIENKIFAGEGKAQLWRYRQLENHFRLNADHSGSSSAFRPRGGRKAAMILSLKYFSSR